MPCNGDTGTRDHPWGKRDRAAPRLGGTARAAGIGFWRGNSCCANARGHGSVMGTKAGKEFIVRLECQNHGMPGSTTGMPGSTMECQDQPRNARIPESNTGSQDQSQSPRINHRTPRPQNARISESQDQSQNQTQNQSQNPKTTESQDPRTTGSIPETQIHGIPGSQDELGWKSPLGSSNPTHDPTPPH